MKKIIPLLLALVSLSFAASAPSPGGGVSVALNPSNALSFLRVNAQGLLLLAAVTPQSTPSPGGNVAVAVDPDGALAFLHVDANGALLTTGTATSGPVTTSGLTMSTARILGRTTASTGAIEEIAAGSGLTLSAGSLSVAADAGLPTQTSNSGKFLTTNGTVSSWSSSLVTALAGTANQITASAATGSITLSLPTTLTNINSITSATSTDLSFATGSTGQQLNFRIGGGLSFHVSGTQMVVDAATAGTTPGGGAFSVAGVFGVSGSNGNVYTSGQIVGKNGTAASPSFTFASATNAGVYLFDDGVGSGMGFAANGSSAGTIDHLGNWIHTGSIKTGAPTTGTAAVWKLGSRVAATVILDTTQYVQLDVAGTLYKVGIVQ